MDRFRQCRSVVRIESFCFRCDPCIRRLKLYYKVDSVGYLRAAASVKLALTLICEGYLCPGRQINVKSLKYLVRRNRR